MASKFRDAQNRTPGALLFRFLHTPFRVRLGQPQNSCRIFVTALLNTTGGTLDRTPSRPHNRPRLFPSYLPVAPPAPLPSPTNQTRCPPTPFQSSARNRTGARKTRAKSGVFSSSATRIRAARFPSPSCSAAWRRTSSCRARSGFHLTRPWTTKSSWRRFSPASTPTATPSSISKSSDTSSRNGWRCCGTSPPRTGTRRSAFWKPTWSKSFGKSNPRSSPRSKRASPRNSPLPGSPPVPKSTPSSRERRTQTFPSSWTPTASLPRSYPR
mmetsp:Transcript_13891/g.52062  ORF Transcript_13891/g.52062 Transcript_13891/m.52062 type:complete len:269 (-) Transcript_13891:276-1082(-)